METVTGAVVSGLSTVATDALGLIGSVVPVALPVVGAVIAVTIGIKAFKRVINK